MGFIQFDTQNVPDLKILFSIMHLELHFEIQIFEFFTYFSLGYFIGRTVSQMIFTLP